MTKPFFTHVQHRLVLYGACSISFLLSLLPPRWLHRLGRGLGLIGYYLSKKYRKLTMNNLALVQPALGLSETEMKAIAKQAFQSLTITCLEYGRLARSYTKIDALLHAKNERSAVPLQKEGKGDRKGIIFLGSHLANWEVSFIDSSHRSPVIAVGRAIDNTLLYSWIVSIREMWGGKIIDQQGALKASLRALKKGVSVGFVADQGLPSSSYSYPFFGVRAWTSSAPGLLSYATGSPIVVVSIKREADGRYLVGYSDPIWPDLTKPSKEEVERLMHEALVLQEQAIRENLGQWLWQHRRWKQPKGLVAKRFSHDAFLVILPEDLAAFEACMKGLYVLRTFYPYGFLTFLVPQSREQEGRGALKVLEGDIITYSTAKEALLDSWLYQVVLDFADISGCHQHYLKLGAFEVVNFLQLGALAKKRFPTIDTTDVYQVIFYGLIK